MNSLATIREMLRYSDWANAQVLAAAAAVADERLDQSIDMGVGSLRRTLLHIYNGECVWLQRWQGHADTPWPAEDERMSAAMLRDRHAACSAARDAYLGTLAESDLLRRVAYRDSRGSYFSATLGQMMLQACFHSTHHRAQAVNMIRRLGGPVVELDYMVWVRRPA